MVGLLLQMTNIAWFGGTPSWLNHHMFAAQNQYNLQWTIWDQVLLESTTDSPRVSPVNVSEKRCEHHMKSCMDLQNGWLPQARSSSPGFHCGPCYITKTPSFLRWLRSISPFHWSIFWIHCLRQVLLVEWMDHGSSGGPNSICSLTSYSTYLISNMYC